MITEFEITEEDMKKADEFAKGCIERGITDPDDARGVNGGSIFQRFYQGYLGEIAFNKFLIANKVKDKILWSRDGDETAGKGDFSFGEKIIDVKTATQNFHIRLMIPVAQYNRFKCAYYVALKRENNKIVVKGYATAEDLEKAEIGDFGIGATKWIFHSKLRDIKGLVEQEILKKWEKL